MSEISPVAAQPRPSTATRSGPGALARAWAWLRANTIRIYVGCAITYLLLPIAVIIAFSFNESTGRYNLAWGGFSLDAWSHAFSIPGLTEALLTSLKLAALTALVATALGTGMALALVRHRFFGRRVANFLLIVPMTSPEIVIGSALLSFFLILGISLGFETLAFAHIMFSISFDRSLEDAAHDLGAGPLATFRLVTLPLILPAVVGAAFLAFVLSLDDFVVSNFNSGTTLTFPLYVFGASQRGIPAQVNVIATMLFVGTVIVGVLAMLRARRRTRLAEPR